MQKILLQMYDLNFKLSSIYCRERVRRGVWKSKKEETQFQGKTEQGIYWEIRRVTNKCGIWDLQKPFSNVKRNMEQYILPFP